MSFTAI